MSVCAYFIQVWSPYLAKDIDLMERYRGGSLDYHQVYVTYHMKLNLNYIHCTVDGNQIETYKLLNAY